MTFATFTQALPHMHTSTPWRTHEGNRPAIKQAARSSQSPATATATTASIFEVAANSTYLLTINALETLSTDYATRTYTHVVSYLQRWPHLVPLLQAAVPHVEAVFGSGLRMILEVVDDPEAPQQLMAYIPTKLAPEQAVAKINEFDSAWWLSQLGDAQGKLMFDVEFQ